MAVYCTCLAAKNEEGTDGFCFLPSSPVREMIRIWSCWIGPPPDPVEGYCAAHQSEQKHSPRFLKHLEGEGYLFRDERRSLHDRAAAGAVRRLVVSYQAMLSRDKAVLVSGKKFGA